MLLLENSTQRVPFRSDKLKSSIIVNHDILRANELNRRDGVVVRASASQLVDLGFIPKSRHTKRPYKMVFTAFLLKAQHIRDSVENKSASLLDVSLDKALNGMPPFSCDGQVAGPSNLPVVVARSDERHANRA